ncbi:hypothetical protein ABMA77_15430 [Halobacteriovorax sp. RZ-1]|uniref:hypothetical protein n=1 Tax=unclassified Halobacteriovorax TaxID=2639665 RepID=UPI0037240C71
MIKLLSKILFKITEYEYSLPLSREEQKLLLFEVDKVNVDEKKLERSYKQYLAEKNISRKTKFALLNIVSFLLFIPIFLVLLTRYFFLVKGESQSNISLFKNLPIILEKKYEPLVINKPFGAIDICLFLKALNNCLKVTLSPYFILRIIWKLSIYKQIVLEHQPKVIIISGEMNFESSFLTYFCNDLGIEHINIMHGEKYYFIKDSYSYFNSFYVWDEYYINLFKSLNGHADNFFVYNIMERYFNCDKNEFSNILKYYSQISSSFGEFKERVSNLMNYANENNLDLVIRFHPSHIKKQEVEYVKKLNINVESSVVSLLESLLESKIICAESSTVLTQAFALGFPVVVDNTSITNYNRLKNLGLYILTQKHELLVKNT